MDFLAADIADPLRRAKMTGDLAEVVTTSTTHDSPLHHSRLTVQLVTTNLPENDVKVRMACMIYVQ